MARSFREVKSIVNNPTYKEILDNAENIIRQWENHDIYEIPFGESKEEGIKVKIARKIVRLHETISFLQDIRK